jgi:hypothetical protein
VARYNHLFFLGGKEAGLSYFWGSGLGFLYNTSTSGESFLINLLLPVPLRAVFF